MFRTILAALAAAATLAVAATPAAASPWPNLPSHAIGCYSEPSPLLCRVRYWVSATWTAESKRGLAKSRYGEAAEHTTSKPYRYWLGTFWRTRAYHYQSLPVAPPISHTSQYRVFLCIHSGEGAWNDDTGNGFYGGLQFMESTWISAGGSRYAPYPHEASPGEQIAVAEHLVNDLGASYDTQWPNTAPPCGV